MCPVDSRLFLFLDALGVGNAEQEEWGAGARVGRFFGWFSEAYANFELAWRLAPHPHVLSCPTSPHTINMGLAFGLAVVVGEMRQNRTATGARDVPKTRTRPTSTQKAATPARVAPAIHRWQSGSQDIAPQKSYKERGTVSRHMLGTAKTHLRHGRDLQQALTTPFRSLSLIWWCPEGVFFSTP